MIYKTFKGDIKLWERVILFFIPGKWEYIDIMGEDMEILIKKLGGRTYVMAERPEGGR